jgi:BirA family biotin operon repressor/biotin-[acetyl-CoA-carboxylase] ligase
MFRVETYGSLTSTNNIIMERAVKGESEWLVVAANEQTAGRGRQGRRYYSPGGTGVYFSVLLRPCADIRKPQLITAAAAVAVAEEIEAQTGVSASIKWVNDVFCGDGKVCGILTEGAVDMESGGLMYAAMGIGVNVAAPQGGFPAELDGVAGAVYAPQRAPADARNKLIAGVLTRFAEYYPPLGKRSFLRAYRERSNIIGREIEIISGGAVERADALDIDDECRLVVRRADGTVGALDAGEVRIARADPD